MASPTHSYALACLALSLAACTSGSTPAPTESPARAGSWAIGPAMPEARLEGFAVPFQGRIWYLGGITGAEGDQSSARSSDRVDVYDPPTGLWSLGPPIPPGAARHHLAVAVHGARIYLLGGFTGILGGAREAGKFVPNGQTWALDGKAWVRLADQPLVRGSAIAATVGERIFVAGGGFDDRGALVDLLAYHPATDTWAPFAPMPTPREHAAACVQGGKLVVVGGWAGEFKAVVAAAERFDPATNQWQKLANMPTERGGLAAVALGTDCHVLGGERWDVHLPGTFASHEVLGANGLWSARAPLPEARHGLGLVVLGGQIFAIAGAPVMGNSYTARLDVFTP